MVKCSNGVDDLVGLEMKALGDLPVIRARHLTSLFSVLSLASHCHSSTLSNLFAAEEHVIPFYLTMDFLAKGQPKAYPEYSDRMIVGIFFVRRKSRRE